MSIDNMITVKYGEETFEILEGHKVSYVIPSVGYLK